MSGQLSRTMTLKKGKKKKKRNKLNQSEMFRTYKEESPLQSKNESQSRQDLAQPSANKQSSRLSKVQNSGMTLEDPHQFIMDPDYYLNTLSQQRNPLVKQEQVSFPP